MKKYLPILLLVAAISGCKKNECANDTLIGKNFTITEVGTAIPLTNVNIFTPNGDGRNDYFDGPPIVSAYFDSVSSSSLKIYCGSDQLASLSGSPGWDGGGQGEGVYRYEAVFHMVNGGTATADGYVRLSKGMTVSCQEETLFNFPQYYETIPCK